MRAPRARDHRCERHDRENRASPPATMPASSPKRPRARAQFRRCAGTGLGDRRSATPWRCVEDDELERLLVALVVAGLGALECVHGALLKFSGESADDGRAELQSGPCLSAPGPDLLRGKTSPAGSIGVVTDFIGPGSRVRESQLKLKLERLREIEHRRDRTLLGTPSRNVGRRINFQYLTTSGIGQEASDPFGPRTLGIELWHRIKTSADTLRRAADINALKNFFIEEGRLLHTIIDFLRSATDAQIVEELVLPIEWVTAASRSAVLLDMANGRKLTSTSIRAR